MSKIRFQIVPPIDRSETPVFITGSHPALGDWDPQKALELKWHPPYQTGSFDAETGCHFEYKIIRGCWESEAVDAYGHVPANSSHDVWLDATLHHTVAEWKDRYTGRLTHESLHSRILAGSRELRIWLPPTYNSEPAHRFPVIMFHDGNNVFDPRMSVISGVDWAADEWATLLARQSIFPESIVVGICHPEGYSGENATLRDFDLSPELGGDAYARFVTTELVPHMDNHYRTIGRADSRTLAGASLGALNTFHTAIWHPSIFGNFICLSTSFEDVSQSFPEQAAALQLLSEQSDLPKNVRMYFDYGDQGLDECYDGYHRILSGILQNKGWKEGVNYSVKRIAGGSHSELSWRTRLGDALRFVAR